MQVSKWFLVVGLIIGLGLAGFFYNRHNDAPVINLKQVALINPDTAEKITLASLKGRPVFINFFTTTCKVCLENMPAIIGSKEQLEEMGVIYLIVSDEDAATITAFRDKHNINLPFMQLSGSSHQELGLQFMPTTYVLDPDGRVVFNRIGPFGWDQPIFLDEAKRLADGQ